MGAEIAYNADQGANCQRVEYTEAMRRFRFRFEAVQKQREARLDEARGVLAEVMGRHTLAEGLLAERRQELNTCLERNNEQPITPGQEMLRQRHIFTLREEVRRREYQMTQLEERLEEARESVSEAHREVKAMEILEERDREEWLLEMKREEQKLNDDLIGSRHGRS